MNQQISSRIAFTLFLVLCGSPLPADEPQQVLKKAGGEVEVQADGSAAVSLITRVVRGPFGEPLENKPPQITPEVLAALSAMPGLKALNLSRVILADKPELVKTIAGLQDLEVLHLPFTGLNDKQLTTLKPLTNLKILNLNNCRGLTDTGLANLSAFKQLETLDLTSTGMTDDGLKPLAACADLRSLNLKFTRVQGSGLRHLAALNRLASIELQADKSTADRNRLDLTGLSQGFRNLKQLRVGGNELGNELITAIGNMLQLEELSINTSGFHKLTDEALADIARQFPNLTSLHINGAKEFSDAGVARLIGMKKLASLDLQRSGISPAAAETFIRLPALKSLRVMGTRFGPGVDAMRKARPEVKVELHRLVH